MRFCSAMRPNPDQRKRAIIGERITAFLGDRRAQLARHFCHSRDQWHILTTLNDQEGPDALASSAAIRAVGIPDFDAKRAAFAQELHGAVRRFGPTVE
ncbi:MAG: hypothetical protein KGJ78_11050 [Alphaproteobacteria bacterium]|nr:hypothetical protein [Alphaproteobacteria bacterium]